MKMFGSILFRGEKSLDPKTGAWVILPVHHGVLILQLVPVLWLPLENSRKRTQIFRVASKFSCSKWTRAHAHAMSSIGLIFGFSGIKTAARKDYPEVMELTVS